MKFRSFSKNLRLFVKAPYREPFQGGLYKDHLGEFIQFKNGYYETEEEKDVAFLKAHNLFSEQANLPSVFWVYVDIVDIHKAEMAQKDREIEALKKQLADSAVAPIASPTKEELKKIQSEKMKAVWEKKRAEKSAEELSPTEPSIVS